MRDESRKALDFAIAKEREAEAFYKEWAQKVSDPAAKGLFAELAGIEHGHAEMLNRITPADMMARYEPPPTDLHLSDWLVDVPASPDLTLQEALIVAMKREERAVALYTRLAEMNGEAKSLFRALAREEASHKSRLEASYDDEILTEN